MFQFNPDTGHRRINCRCASLANLEIALELDDEKAVDLAICRMLLIHGIILANGDIPTLYKEVNDWANPNSLGL